MTEYIVKQSELNAAMNEAMLKSDEEINKSGIDKVERLIPLGNGDYVEKSTLIKAIHAFKMKDALKEAFYRFRLREAQIDIAYNNYLHDHSIFKIGDKEKGWIPKKDELFMWRTNLAKKMINEEVGFKKVGMNMENDVMKKMPRVASIISFAIDAMMACNYVAHDIILTRSLFYSLLNEKNDIAKLGREVGADWVMDYTNTGTGLETIRLWATQITYSNGFLAPMLIAVCQQHAVMIINLSIMGNPHITEIYTCAMKFEQLNDLNEKMKNKHYPEFRDLRI